MIDPKLIELLAGAFMPFIIDIVNKNINNSDVRYFVSMAICLVLGVLLNIGQLNVRDVLTSGAIVFASAQSVYKLYWAGSNARTKMFGEQIRK